MKHERKLKYFSHRAPEISTRIKFEVLEWNALKECDVDDNLECYLCYM